MIPRLCFITDADAPLSIPEQAEYAARGGAGWVQLRHKTLGDAEFLSLAYVLKGLLSELGTKLIINDRVDLAREVGAAGLHIGQSDGNPENIHTRIGPDMILGLSIETEAQVAHIPEGCVDYLGVGPVRATTTKPDHAPPIGFEGLARIVRATDLPVMAIGGLNFSDIPDLQAAGCQSLAVVSAISRDADPESAARNFLDRWGTS